MKLTGSLLTKLVLILSLVSLGGVVSCKKKSSKKKKKATTEVKQPKEAVDPKDEQKFGEEYIVGDTIYFRGADQLFVMQATPHRVNVGSPVAFEATCGSGDAGTVVWNMGDRQARSEKKFQHTYYYANTYKVTATCTENGASQSGTITVEVVVDGSGGSRPGQNPNQNQN